MLRVRGGTLAFRSTTWILVSKGNATGVRFKGSRHYPRSRPHVLSNLATSSSLKKSVLLLRSHDRNLSLRYSIQLLVVCQAGIRLLVKYSKYSDARERDESSRSAGPISPSEDISIKDATMLVDEALRYTLSARYTSFRSLTPFLDKDGFFSEVLESLVRNPLPVVRLHRRGMHSSYKQSLCNRLIDVVTQFVYKHADTWPLPTLEHALFAFTKENGTEFLFKQMLGCPNVTFDAVANLMRLTGDQSIARKPSMEWLYSYAMYSLQSDDVDRAVATFLFLFERDIGDQEVLLPFRSELFVKPLLLKLLASPLTGDRLRCIICALHYHALDWYQWQHDILILSADLLAVVRQVEAWREIPADTCTELIVQLTTMANYVYPRYDPVGLDCFFLHPLASNLLSYVANFHVPLNTLYLKYGLRVLYVTKLVDTGTIDFLTRQLWSSPSFLFHAELRVEVCYYLAFLRVLPKGELRPLLPQWSELSFERKVQLVLASAIVDEFLLEEWLVLVDLINEDGVDLEHHYGFVKRIYHLHLYTFHVQKARRCLLPHHIDLIVDAVTGRHDILHNRSFCTALVDSSEGRLTWYDLWRIDPLTGSRMYDLAAVVIQSDRSFIPYQSSLNYDSSSRKKGWPVYFIQGNLHPTGELDGLQLLRYHTFHGRLASFVVLPKTDRLIEVGDFPSIDAILDLFPTRLLADRCE